MSPETLVIDEFGLRANGEGPITDMAAEMRDLLSLADGTVQKVNRDPGLTDDGRRDRRARIGAEIHKMLGQLLSRSVGRIEKQIAPKRARLFPWPPDLSETIPVDHADDFQRELRQVFRGMDESAAREAFLQAARDGDALTVSALGTAPAALRPNSITDEVVGEAREMLAGSVNPEGLSELKDLEDLVSGLRGEANMAVAAASKMTGADLEPFRAE